MKKWNNMLLGMALLTNSAYAQQDLTIQEWLDIYVETCVGSGESVTASGSLNAGLGLSLKKMTAEGDVAGQIQVQRSSYRLLSEGISNAMSSVAADQADKLRECLSPMRQTILAAMQQDMGTTTGASTIYILDPYEEKIMKVLASAEGMDGEAGQMVKSSDLIQMADMSSIRFRATIRSLQLKFLAGMLKNGEVTFEPGGLPDIKDFDVISLTPYGEEYVLRMGYAR